jgi:hypothetical protein
MLFQGSFLAGAYACARKVPGKSKKGCEVRVMRIKRSESTSDAAGEAAAFQSYLLFMPSSCPDPFCKTKRQIYIGGE